MQFIMLNNFKSILRAGANATSPTFVDTSGTSRSFGSVTVSAIQAQKAKMPLICNTGNNMDYSVPHASSAATVPENTTTILDEVGTTTYSYANNSKGWSLTMTVTSVSDATIKHFIFERKIAVSSSTSYDTVIFAIKLDTPVELNAGNNHSASFTFAIEF